MIRLVRLFGTSIGQKMVVAVTGALRLASAAALGALTLVYAGANGAVVGLLAWIVSYAVESAVLRLRLRTVRLRDEVMA